MSKLKPKQVQERNIKSRVKINEIKNRKTIEKINTTKNWFRKISYTDKDKIERPK